MVHCLKNTDAPINKNNKTTTATTSPSLYRRDHRTQPLCTCKHPKFSFIPCKQEGSINTGSDPIKHSIISSIISSPPNRPCSQNDQGIEPLQHTSTYPVTSLLPPHKEIQIIRKRRDSLKSKTAQKPMPKLPGKHTCREKVVDCLLFLFTKRTMIWM